MDLLRRVVAVIALIYLSMMAGAAVMIFHVFPSEHFARTAMAGYALYILAGYQIDEMRGRPSVHSWYPVRRDVKGLTKYDQAKSYEGLTFYLVSPLQRAELLSMDGKVVHSWHLPYSKIWQENDPIADPIGDSDIAWEFAHPFPNGDLLVVFRANYKVPYGYGVAKIDRNSRLIWKNLNAFHHELDVAPDGRIFGLAQSISERTVEGFPHIKPPMVEDFLVEISPEGKITQKISFFDAMQNSSYRIFLATVPRSKKGDYLHVNSVDYIDEAEAAQLGFAKAGEVMVSFRNPSIITVINPDQGKVVWALRGPWSEQHDPDILENGHILVFDNRGHVGEGGFTRVIEFDPIRQATVWQYTGTRDEPFETAKRGSQQRLANGNTLITESHGGRLFEVNAADEIVWEFHTTVRSEGNQAFLPYIRYARRYPKDWFEFAMGNQGTSA